MAASIKNTVSAMVITAGGVIFLHSAALGWTCTGVWNFGPGDVTLRGTGSTEQAARDDLNFRCRDRDRLGGTNSCLNPARNLSCNPDPGESLPPPTASGPPVTFCTGREKINNSISPINSNIFTELFGERTGDRRSCAITPKNIRASKVFCAMGTGGLGSVPPDPLKNAPGCYDKFYDTSACEVGYAGLHETKNYIDAEGRQIICVQAEAQPGTGLRYWGIIIGN